MFEEGDIVVTSSTCNGATKGKELLVFKASGGELAINDEGYWRSGMNACTCTSNWKLISKKSDKKVTMSLAKSFALVFKKEPEKSFQKACVTDSNDVLTTEGTLVFLSWMLKKHGEEFKKEVVDAILAEQEKKA